MNQVRLCVLDSPGLAQVSVVSGRVTGPFGLAYQAASTMLGLRANVTLLKSDKAGDFDFVTKAFDGCLGHLQRNESDLMLPMVELPIPAPGLEQGYVITASSTTMVSAYSTWTASSLTDVMDAFKGLSRAVWSLSLAMIFVLCLLLCSNVIVGSKRRYKRHAFRRWLGQVGEYRFSLFCY